MSREVRGFDAMGRITGRVWVLGMGMGMVEEGTRMRAVFWGGGRWDGGERWVRGIRLRARE